MTRLEELREQLAKAKLDESHWQSIFTQSSVDRVSAFTAYEEALAYEKLMETGYMSCQQRVANLECEIECEEGRA